MPTGPFSLATGGAQTVKIWSSKLLMATILKTYYRKFASSGPNNVIQVLEDLSRGKGDQIKFDALSLMAADYWGLNQNGVVNARLAGAVAGAEQALVYNQDAITIGQKRLSHTWNRMSSQRSLHDFMNDSLDNLSSRLAVILDSQLMAHLVGTTGTGGNGASLLSDFNGGGLGALAFEGANLSGGVPSGAVDAGHAIAAPGSGVAFSTEHIDAARWKAETITDVDTGPVQKLKIDGIECYVAFIRPEAANSLQNDDDWIQAQRHAEDRGSKNPLFEGSLGMWNNVVLHVSSYLPFNTPGGGNQLGQNVLCGKQAAVFAYGNAFDALDREKYQHDGPFAFVPRDTTDYGQEKGVQAGGIWGCKRVVVNAKSFGVMTMPSTDPSL